MLIALLVACHRDDPPADVRVREVEVVGDAGGPLAQAVPGDLVLENAVLRVVLQQPGRAIALNPYGGTIVDAERRDQPGSDRFGEVGLFLNAAFTQAPDTMEVVDDGANGAAVVRFTGPAVRSGYIDAGVGLEQVVGLDFPIDTLDVPDLRLTTTYTLAPGADDVRVDVEIENTGAAAVPLAPGWLAHLGLAEPYHPDLGGFRKPAAATGGALLAVSDELVYGFAPLPFAPGAHGLASMAGGAVLMDSRGILELLDWPDAAVVTLAPGDRFAFDAAFTVGHDLSDVLSTFRTTGAPAADVSIGGHVTSEGAPAAGVRVAALAPGEDRVLASARTDESGAFTLRVPPGPVELAAGKDGWPYAGGGSTPARVAIEAGEGAAVDLTLPPTSALTVRARDPRGHALPARVLVVGIDPSPPWRPLSPGAFDPLPPGIAAIVDLPASGEATFDLEPGEYEVVFTRGPEYDALSERIALSPGAEGSADAVLHRVLDTTGLLSADFHVHSAPGPDVVSPDDLRVADFAAEGVEVLVATNHEYVSDLGPVIDTLGLGDWLISVPGQEVTPFDYGHFGLFPMIPDEDSPNRGALDWEGRSPVDIFDWADAQPHSPIVQINHPRAVPTVVDTQNYFTVLDLSFDGEGPYIGPEASDPLGTGLPEDAEMFGGGFAAMEVMTWLNVQGLSDWFNLLNSGYVFTATANSDTHTSFVEGAGWPRNFVDVGTDDPRTLDAADLAAAVRGLRSSGSFGPLVTMRASTDDGAPVSSGGTLTTGGAPVQVQIRVQAAPWVPVQGVEVYAGGELVAAEVVDLVDVPGFEGGTRREQTLTVWVDAPTDTWIAVIVEGGSLFPYVPYHETSPGDVTAARLDARDVVHPATAFGFANPVFIDTDGDGQITPSHHIVLDDAADWRREDRLDPY